MTRRRAALVLVLAVTAAAPRAGAGGLDPKKALTQYNLDAWTTESGLPQNTITAVVQTRDGYLWLGTFGGLARFDGVRFVVLDKSTTPALSNSGVHALLADRDGGCGSAPTAAASCSSRTARPERIASPMASGRTSSDRCSRTARDASGPA